MLANLFRDVFDTVDVPLSGPDASGIASDPVMFLGERGIWVDILHPNDPIQYNSEFSAFPISNSAHLQSEAGVDAVINYARNGHFTTIYLTINDSEGVFWDSSTFTVKPDLVPILPSFDGIDDLLTKAALYGIEVYFAFVTMRTQVAEATAWISPETVYPGGQSVAPSLQFIDPSFSAARTWLADRVEELLLLYPKATYSALVGVVSDYHRTDRTNKTVADQADMTLITEVIRAKTDAAGVVFWLWTTNSLSFKNQGHLGATWVNDGKADGLIIGMYGQPGFSTTTWNLNNIASLYGEHTDGLSITDKSKFRIMASFNRRDNDTNPWQSETDIKRYVAIRKAFGHFDSGLDIYNVAQANSSILANSLNTYNDPNPFGDEVATWESAGYGQLAFMCYKTRPFLDYQGNSTGDNVPDNDPQTHSMGVSRRIYNITDPAGLAESSINFNGWAGTDATIVADSGTITPINSNADSRISVTLMQQAYAAGRTFRLFARVTTTVADQLVRLRLSEVGGSAVSVDTIAGDMPIAGIYVIAGPSFTSADVGNILANMYPDRSAGNAELQDIEWWVLEGAAADEYVAFGTDILGGPTTGYLDVTTQQTATITGRLVDFGARTPIDPAGASGIKGACIESQVKAGFAAHIPMNMQNCRLGCVVQPDWITAPANDIIEGGRSAADDRIRYEFITGTADVRAIVQAAGGAVITVTGTIPSFQQLDEIGILCVANASLVELTLRNYRTGETSVFSDVSAGSFRNQFTTNYGSDTADFSTNSGKFYVSWTGHGTSINLPDVVISTQPSIPQNVTHSVKTDTTITYVWDPSTPGPGRTIAGYRCYLGGVFQTNTPIPTWQAVGLPADTSQTFTVRAYDSELPTPQESDLSDPYITSTEAANLPPTAVTSYQGLVLSGSKIGLGWEQATDPDGTIIEYPVKQDSVEIIRVPH